MDVLQLTHESQKKYHEIAKKLADDENKQAQIFVALLNAYSDGKEQTIKLYDGRLS